MTQFVAAEAAPTSPLMTFILAALSSMMAPTLADHHLARLAAREAIDTCQTRGQHELLTIGQIVGFAVTALDTLRLSMPEEVSLPMKLRLRANANGLNRSSRDGVRLLEKTRLPPKTQLPPKTGRGSAAPAPVAAAQTPVSVIEPDPRAQPLTGLDWGHAMKSVAETLQADAATASPTQQKTDALWIEALTAVAGELIQEKLPATNPGSRAPSR